MGARRQRTSFFSLPSLYPLCFPPGQLRFETTRVKIITSAQFDEARLWCHILSTLCLLVNQSPRQSRYGASLCCFTWPQCGLQSSAAIAKLLLRHCSAAHISAYGINSLSCLVLMTYLLDFLIPLLPIEAISLPTTSCKRLFSARSVCSCLAVQPHLAFLAAKPLQTRLTPCWCCLGSFPKQRHDIR